MPSERWARALLRLYPRAWRERYGDEFLVLIDDAGLTWRTALDVVASAAAERARAIAALASERVHTTHAIKFGTPLRGREVFTDFVVFNACVALVMVALRALGVPFPRWNTLVMFLMQWNGSYEPIYSLHQHRSDRLTQPIVWFLAAVVLVAAGCIVGAALRSAGVPEPGNAAYYTPFCLYFGGGAIRLLYCGVRSAIGTWPGVHRHEALAWRIGLWLMTVLTGLADPGWDAFWAFVGMFWMALRPTFDFTREGVAHRRACLEAVERATPIP
jgi:hypothetical protein